MSKLIPVKLRPVFKDYLWGGTKLKTNYNKKSDLDILAESWELSAHKDGQSVVDSGEYADCIMSEYIKKAGKEILGERVKKLDHFPILIKLIDAKRNLSVQVHPDDKYAFEHEGEYGKNEMWYILDCEEGASLYYGFSKDVTRQEYMDAIKNDTLIDILNKVPAHKGDVFFIPAGTVHAIGSGIVVCEIQQSSNITYRVYDYNRRDKDGNTRSLHIEKAIEASDLKKSSEIKPVPDGNNIILTECEAFTVRRLRVDRIMNIETDTTSFNSLLVTEGNGTLVMNDKKIKINKGDSIFIPAQNGSYTIEGQCELILSCI